MGKAKEITMSRIAGKVRALASLELGELRVALPSFLKGLDSLTSAERFDEIARALGHQAARDAVRLGVAAEWIESDQDPRDICYETWEAEHGEMLETILEASEEEIDEDSEDFLDTLFSVYADSFDASLEEDLKGEDIDWGSDDEEWDDDDEDGAWDEGEEDDRYLA